MQCNIVMGILDLAPFAFTVRARSARTVNAGFGGAKRRRNQLVENAARSEVSRLCPEGVTGNGDVVELPSLWA
jgi:hypothetical protein